jgi:hypothetical protein
MTASTLNVAAIQNLEGCRQNTNSRLPLHRTEGLTQPKRTRTSSIEKTRRP